MTQPSRTTESISRDNEAIREIMHQIRELTVPDRATLALGLVGHLATLMNGRQMAKLLRELNEEAERVQDVPPARRRDVDARLEAADKPAQDDRPDARQRVAGRDSGGGSVQGLEAAAGVPGRWFDDAGAHRGVGQVGRGEYTEEQGRVL